MSSIPQIADSGNNVSNFAPKFIKRVLPELFPLL